MEDAPRQHDDDDDDDDSYPLTFSAELIHHCRAGAVPPKVFRDVREVLHGLPRYVRIHPRAASSMLSSVQQHNQSHNALDGSTNNNIPTSRVEQLRHALATSLSITADEVEVVPWLPCDVFAIPRTLSLHAQALYAHGSLMAMDAASMAAVVALRPRRGDVLLDLCCSPGMKLSLLADAIASSAHNNNNNNNVGDAGFVVGVDISVNRLFAARAVMQKHLRRYAHDGAPRVALIAADGRSVSWKSVVDEIKRLNRPPPTSSRMMSSISSSSPRVHPDSGLTTMEQRAVRQRQLRASTCPSKSNNTCNDDVDDVHLTPLPVLLSEGCREELMRSSEMLFDRVLVDAECSHDGSISHLMLDGDDDAHGTDDDDDDDGHTRHSRGISNRQRMQRMRLGDDHRTSSATTPPSSSSPLVLTQTEMMQLELLHNGFRQLRPGGILVYCTCSFSVRQNELIIHNFLTHINAAPPRGCGGAKLVPAFEDEDDGGGGGSVSHLVRLDDGGRLQHRIDAHKHLYGMLDAGVEQLEMNGVDVDDVCVGGSRLWPTELRTSFQYIAKIVKISPT